MPGLVLLVSLVSLVSAASAVAPGEHLLSVQRPEGERTFYLWVPESYREGTPVPLHLSFHGLGDTCQNYGRNVGFIEEAEKNNFLYAYPCSYKETRAWNAGVCCIDLSGVDPATVDDMAFARAIVANVSSSFSVDSNRVFASGFSNGAFLSSVLGCTAADVFAATASVSGVVELAPGNEGGLAACDAAYKAGGSRVSTVNVHGTLDFVVPFTGDALLGFPPIPEDFKRWAARGNCTGAPAATFKRGAYSGQAYTGCDDGTEVHLVTNAGGGHEWPEDADFNTTSFIVDFFSKHGRS